MNSKQRRKLIRKHIKSITLLRVQSRLDNGDAWLNWTDYELARDFDYDKKAYTSFRHARELAEGLI